MHGQRRAHPQVLHEREQLVGGHNVVFDADLGVDVEVDPLHRGRDLVEDLAWRDEKPVAVACAGAVVIRVDEFPTLGLRAVTASGRAALVVAVPELS